MAAKKSPSRELTVVQLPAPLVKRMDAAITGIASLEIRSSADRVKLGNFLSDVVEMKDQVIAMYEPEYRARKVPFDEIQKERNVKTKFLEKGEKIAREKLAAWERSKRDRLEEVRQIEIAAEQKRLAKEIKKETGKAVDPMDLVVQVATPAAPPPIEGQTYIANWQGECLDLQVLIAEAAAKPHLRQFLSLNEASVRSFAKDHKGAAQALSESLAIRFFDAGSIRVAKG